MESPRLVQLGTVGGSPIMADVTTLGVRTLVTLSADYVLARPVGFPTRPFLTGAANPEYPGKVIPSGSTIGLLQCEAAALVAADAATYV